MQGTDEVDEIRIDLKEGEGYIMKNLILCVGLLFRSILVVSLLAKFI